WGSDVRAPWMGGAPKEHHTTSLELQLSHLPSGQCVDSSVRNTHACHSGRASRLRPASESRNPVNNVIAAFTQSVVYWVPASACPVEPGSLGRDDSNMR